MRSHAARLAAACLLVVTAFASPAAAAEPAGSIPVGAEPYAIAVDAATGRAYVANSGSGTVSVIDVATDQVIAEVFVGGAPNMVELDSVRGRLYVSNFMTEDVAVIDTATLEVVGALAPGGLGLAIDQTRGLLYSAAGPVLGVFDLATGATVATVFANGGSWWDVAVDESTGRLYVTDLQNSAVVVLDPAYQEIARIPVSGEARFGITFDAALGRVYVPNYAAEGSVSVIDAGTLAVIQTVPVGSFPFTLTLSGSTLYSADLGSGTVTILSTTPELSLVETVTTGGSPGQVALVDGGARMYVTNSASSVMGTGEVMIFTLEAPNSAPTVTVSLSDPAPWTREVLIAAAEPTDVDGDPVELTYVWKVNGEVRQTTVTTATTDTFDLAVRGNGNRGDTVTVEVTPSDGEATGTTATATALVRPGH